MIWLITQMWILLFAAFLIGILAGFWIKLHRVEETGFESAHMYEAGDDHSAPSLSSNPQTPSYLEKTDYRNKHENNVREADSLSELPDLVEQRNDPLPTIKTSSRPDTVGTTYEKLPDIATNNESSPLTTSSLKSTSAHSRTPTLYSAPTKGTADDLKRIKGIGPTLERTLNSTGVYYFSQIAAWSDAEVSWIDNRIDFPGRVTREQWVAQSIELAKEKANVHSISSNEDRAQSDKRHEMNNAIRANKISAYELSNTPNRDDAKKVETASYSSQDTANHSTARVTDTSFIHKADKAQNNDTSTHSKADISTLESTGNESMTALDRLMALKNKTS